MNDRARIKRILGKIEIIWVSLPDDGFDTFRWAIENGINSHPDMLVVLTDQEIEQRLDQYIYNNNLKALDGTPH